MMPKQYRVGVIGRTGQGNYGHALDTAWLSHPRTQVVAVADPDSSGRAKAAKRLGVSAAYADYRQMLEETRPEIVSICSRWLDQHHATAMAALDFGCHVYMEKPLCRTLEEADEIVAAGERSHLKIAVAHITHYSPRLEAARKLIADGAIGKVLEYRGRGKEDRRGGGEDLWVLGSHIMDLILAVGGQPTWCFARATVAGKPVTKEDVYSGNEGIGPLAGDAVHAIYKMPDGALATFDSIRDMAGRPSRFGLRIYGSEGIVEILTGAMPAVKYLKDPSWSPGRSGAKWQDVSSAGIGKPEPLTDPKYKERHRLAIDDLIEAIEEERQPKSSVYVARAATEMIVAVFESHRQQGPVALPLKTRVNPLTLL